MSFDPNQPRDENGEWTGSGGSHGPSERARNAVDWIKSPEAKAIISKLTAPEHIKAAATMAIQGALFKISGINEPNVDVAIKQQVASFANDVKVTKAHARQLMITAVKALKRAAS